MEMPWLDRANSNATLLYFWYANRAECKMNLVHEHMSPIAHTFVEPREENTHRTSCNIEALAVKMKITKYGHWSGDSTTY